MIRKKAAFTMIELVMVIVVLGIVASIGADIIAKMYENYIKTRSVNKLQAQSELILNEIAKRLQFRIKDSIIARSDSNFSDYVPLSDANGSYQILEWIGKDNDGFRGISNPGWSGFVDLDSNETDKALGTYGKIKTPGSELNTTNLIIEALSNAEVSLLDTNTTTQRPALIFRGQSSLNLSGYGWDGVEGNYTHKVTYTNGKNDVLNFDENTTNLNEIYEQYDLVWSAYSVVPEGNNTNDFNLTLHYNYQPWEDENYTSGSQALLVEHVSTFKITKSGDTIRLKLCIRDALQISDSNFSFCKERVIY